MKVALVSGGSQGIGLAITKKLLLSEFSVFICARSEDKLLKAYQEINDELSLNKRDVNLYTFCCDASDESEVEKLINTIEHQFGYLNCLVNNSGGISPENSGQFNDLSSLQWLQIFNDNLLGAVNLSKYSHRLLKNAISAKVINIASIVAIQPGLFNPHYAAAKAGLLALSKNLSMVWADDGIKVNAISPGIIETEGWQSYISGKAKQENRKLSDVYEEENARAVSNVPLKRLGLPEEVAECVRYLASPESDYITGENIVIDGGKHRAI